MLDTTSQSEGTGCIKLQQTGGFCLGYTFSEALDISDMGYFVFDMNPQDAEWFQKAGVAQLVISSRDFLAEYGEPDSAEWTEEALIVPLDSVSMEDGWNTVNVPLDFADAAEGFDPTAVKRIMIYGLRYNERPGEENINYIDNVRFSNVVLKQPKVISVNNCDSIEGFYNYPGDGMALDTTEQIEGAGCIKLFQTGGFCLGYTFSEAVDISNMGYFIFNMNPQATDWFEKAGVAKLVISSRDFLAQFGEHDSPEWTERALTVPLSSVTLEEGWNTVTIPLDFSQAAEGFDPTAVKRIMIYGLSYYERDGENINYIDNIRFLERDVPVTPVSAAWLQYASVKEKADGIMTAGQASYTNSSWERFVAAYTAVAQQELDSSTATDEQLAAAVKALQNGMNFLSAKTNLNELDELYSRVIVLGVDGMGNYDTKTETPNLDRLAAQEDTLYTHTAKSVLPTISAQNWGSMLLGVSPAKHGLTNDYISSVETEDYQKYPSIFRYVREKYPLAELASFGNWSAINNGIIEHNLNVKMVGGDDATLTQDMISYFQANDPLFTFVQFDNVDHVGHANGYGSASYYQALQAMDGYIGQLYDALDQLGYLEDTLLLVVTDHGGKGTNHGGSTDQEVLCSYYAKGKNVTSGQFESELTTASLSSVVATALGVPQSGDYDYTTPNGFFQGYTYTAPSGDEWKLKTPAEQYRFGDPQNPAVDGYGLDRYVDTDALKAYFKFEDSLENQVEASDISATPIGEVTYKEGYFGNGLEGTITLNNLDIGENDFTFSAWYKDISVPGGDPALFGNKDWNSGTNQGILVCAENDQIKINTSNDSGRVDSSMHGIDSYSFNGESGRVHIMVVGNRTAGTVTLYVDFLPVETIKVGSGSYSALEGCVFNVGGDGTSDNSYGSYATFTMDEVLYMDKAIGDSEISALRDYYAQTEKSVQILKAVNALYEQIKAIGEVTEENCLEKEAVITAAREAYTTLTASAGSQQVDNMADLVAAEAVLAGVKQAAEDAEAAAAVDALIEAFPETITIDNAEQVNAAKAAYDALTDAQKALVKEANVNALTAALEIVTVPTYTLGDVDNSGKIDAADALIVLKIAVGKYEATDDEKAASNVNKDDKIDAVDALEILKKAVGKEACF